MIKYVVVSVRVESERNCKCYNSFLFFILFYFFLHFAPVNYWPHQGYVLQLLALSRLCVAITGLIKVMSCNYWPYQGYVLQLLALSRLCVAITGLIKVMCCNYWPYQGYVLQLLALSRLCVAITGLIKVMCCNSSDALKSFI